MTRLQHAFEKESTARICLQRDESTARKRTRAEEESASNKRLKKASQDMIWDIREVMTARGVPAEEQELYIAQQANRLDLV